MIARNVHNATDAFMQILSDLRNYGKQITIKSNPANVSPTIEVLDYVITIARPWLRENYVVERKWSSKAAFAEFCWYMTGNRNIDIIAKYIPGWTKFVDNYPTNRLAVSNYGAIWKDQIPALIKHLKTEPDTRRGCIQIYDSQQPNKYVCRDMPCTLSLDFNIRDDKLYMTTFMRSNDVVFGFCNDVFAFTMLQELIANELGVEMGSYTHHAVSMHIYEKHFNLLDNIGELTMQHTFDKVDLKADNTYSTFWQDKQLFEAFGVDYNWFAKWLHNPDYVSDVMADIYSNESQYYNKFCSAWQDMHELEANLASLDNPMSVKEYVDKYCIKSEAHKRCKCCGNELPWLDELGRYNDICIHCAQHNHI